MFVNKMKKNILRSHMRDKINSTYPTLQRIIPKFLPNKKINTTKRRCSLCVINYKMALKNPTAVRLPTI